VPERFWNFQELPTFVLNEVCVDEARLASAARPVGFVYQRYSLNNFSGVQVSRDLRVPLVLEYNGSELWMSRHWGQPLKYEAIASRIERLNVTAADLLVVVSRAMRDELIARGVDAERILVNPNAVDPERYSPSIDGSRVRAQLGLGESVVVGFISTFAPWHGATVLARGLAAQRHRVARTTGGRARPRRRPGCARFGCVPAGATRRRGAARCGRAPHVARPCQSHAGCAGRSCAVVPRMIRRLLAISWDIPPMSGPRAVQVSRLLNHLVPLGWESTVIGFTPASNRYNPDPDLADRLRAPGLRWRNGCRSARCGDSCRR
jgi:hypothetical protein